MPPSNLREEAVRIVTTWWNGAPVPQELWGSRWIIMEACLTPGHYDPEKGPLRAYFERAVKKKAIDVYRKERVRLPIKAQALDRFTDPSEPLLREEDWKGESLFPMSPLQQEVLGLLARGVPQWAMGVAVGGNRNTMKSVLRRIREQGRFRREQREAAESARRSVHG